jgi:hypothetical protein
VWGATDSNHTSGDGVTTQIRISTRDTVIAMNPSIQCADNLHLSEHESRLLLLGCKSMFILFGLLALAITGPMTQLATSVTVVDAVATGRANAIATTSASATASTSLAAIGSALVPITGFFLLVPFTPLLLGQQ